MIAAAFTLRGLAVAALAKLVIGMAVLFAGCTTSQLSAHASAARLTRPALDGVATGLEVACSEEAARGLGQADDAEGYAQLRQRCARGQESHKVAREAWLGYLDAVLAAASGGRVDLADVLAWGVRVVHAYTAVAALLRELGHDPPPLPAELAGLERPPRDAGGSR